MEDVNELSTDVLVAGAGPAGSAAAIWLARAGFDVVLADQAVFPRDKTCGDGLTPRAMAELRRLGLDEWALERITIRGLRLRGFGAEREIPWPAGRFGQSGSAVPRTELDHKLVQTAAAAGVRVVEGMSVHLGGPLDDGRACGRPLRLMPAGAAGADGAPTQTVRARFLVAADGARSTLSKTLGRQWHREMVYATAGRCYIRSEMHDYPWIGSDLELRDAQGRVQPGYGWVFPLGNGEVNLGVGALSTKQRPAHVQVRELMRHYAEQVRDDWQLEGELRAPASALLPMGGAVSHVAGRDWALTGDAAALINPLNGEGIDYALEAGRLLAEVVTKEVGTPGPEGLGGAWPEVLRREFGPSFALARRLAELLTYPQFLPRIGPLGMGSDRLMTAAVRCMGNVVTADDADFVSAAWRTWGAATRATERPLGRPLFA